MLGHGNEAELALGATSRGRSGSAGAGGYAAASLGREARRRAGEKRVCCSSREGNATMPRAKIRHIAISTDDPERTAAWYKEVFGLEEVGKSPVGVYLTDGTINFAVLRIPSETNPGEPARGVHHFGF